MKKIFTLLSLAFIGAGVQRVAAEDITVYLSASSDILDDNPSLALRGWNDTENNDDAPSYFTLVSSDFGSNIYKTTIDSKYTKHIILRYKTGYTGNVVWNDNENFWNQSGNIEETVSGNMLYVCEGFNDGKINVAPYSNRLADDKYYFVLAQGAGSEEYTKGDALTSSDGIISGTLTNKADYRFTCAPCYNFDTSGNFTWLRNVLKPAADSGDWYLNFYDYTDQNGNGSQGIWYTTNNDAAISFSYNLSTNKWTVTNAQSVTVGAAGWASYSNSYAFKADKDAYVIGSIEDGYAKLTKVDAGTTFAAEAGVLFQENTTITPATGDTYAGVNKLSGSGNSGATIATDDLVLGVSDGVTGFYKLSTTTLPAHKAYLTAANAAGASAISLVFDDEQTGINNVNSDQQGMAIYNLQGQRQQSLKKGLNIVGGKKLLVK